MTRRLGGDRKTKQQQEMFDVDTWLSVCQFFHFPNRKIFPCRRNSTVSPPSVKLSTNLKQEMNLSALLSQSQKAKPQQSTSPRRGKLRQREAEDHELRESSVWHRKHVELQVSLIPAPKAITSPELPFLFPLKRVRKDK